MKDSVTKKIIIVKIRAKAKSNCVEEFDQFVRVTTTAVPEKGQANKAIIKLLSQHYNVAQNKIKIIQGTKMRRKIVEIGL